MRNAQDEARAALGNAYEPRVLEPSPPAVAEPPFFADDAAVAGDVSGLKVVLPVSTAELSWDQIAAERPELAGFITDRWLGAYRRLGPAPEGLVEVRMALHHVAEHVMKPAREAANGKFGLRYTYRGFGTPFFGEDQQLRVEDTWLVDQRGADEQRTLLEGVDPGCAAAIADWFGFGTSVLEEVRAAATPEAEASRVQIWPEHFDVALELGAESAGIRAAYGASPGDEAHPEPYLYVAPWSAKPEGELWQAQGFSGAELSYAELLEAEDQRGAAIEFFTTRHLALGQMTQGDK